MVLLTRAGVPPGHLRRAGSSLEGRGKITPQTRLKTKRNIKTRKRNSIALNEYLHSKVSRSFAAEVNNEAIEGHERSFLAIVGIFAEIAIKLLHYSC